MPEISDDLLSGPRHGLRAADSSEISLVQEGRFRIRQLVALRAAETRLPGEINYQLPWLRRQRQVINDHGAADGELR